MFITELNRKALELYTGNKTEQENGDVVIEYFASTNPSRVFAFVHCLNNWS